MSAAAEKARARLESSVSQLRELERKGIFSKDELGSIARKRSDFEHAVNARGVRPFDFAQYATYEINLESLRRKRAKRLGVKTKQGPDRSGQRQVYFIFERGTRKFPGDIALWLQYIDFATKQNSYKKLAKLFTTVLRLHPTRPELWILAARHALDGQADMNAARNYMQRGLRFCRRSELLWLEYAKLEMIFIAKIVGRRHILGIAGEERLPENSGLVSNTGEENEEDVITVPDVPAAELVPKYDRDEKREQALEKAAAESPVTAGRIPITIFDNAMAEFGDEASVALDFFNMFVTFDHLPCVQNILTHIDKRLQESHPHSSEYAVCRIEIPLLNVPTDGETFPRALATSLSRANEFMDSRPELRRPVSEQLIMRLTPFLNEQNLDEGIRRVIIATLRKSIRNISGTLHGGQKIDEFPVATLVSRMRTDGRDNDALWLLREALESDGSNERLQQLLREVQDASV